MKSIFLSILILLFLAFNLYSQKSIALDSIARLVSNCQFSSALEIINRQLSLYPKTGTLFYYQGLALKGEAKHLEAIHSFKNALNAETNNIPALIELATCYKMTGNMNKALIYLLKADSIRPNIAVKIELANLLYNSDRYFDALAFYRELLEADTSNIYLLRSVGHCYSNLDLKDSAILYFEKAAKLNPLDFQSVYNACLIYLNKRAYAKGIVLTRKFISSDSTDIRINRMNAYLYLLNSNYDTAVLMFNKCIAKDDTSIFVNKYLGVAYFKLEKYDTAKIFLEKAYFKDSMDIKTCNFLGISCTQSYYKKLGIHYSDRAIQLSDPTNLSALYKNLGNACNGFYKPKEGLEAFLKAISLNPNDTMLLYDLAYQYDFELKDPENSLKYYNDFLKTRPPHDSLHPERKIKYLAYTTYDEKTQKYLDISYYDMAEKRVKEIQDWLKKKRKINKPE